MSATLPTGTDPIEGTTFVRAALKVLTQHLRDLVRDGLVEREEVPTRPPQVSYCFSAYGRSLIPVLQTLCAWGQLYVER